MLWTRKLGYIGYSTWTIVATVICAICVWTSAGESVRKIRNNKHHTKFACEGELLNITCPVGHVINIVRANYGRFSLLTCNDRNEAWTDVQCMYPKSTRVMEERCQHKQACHVPADDQTFGDECPETYKYLETTFECRTRATVVPSTIAQQQRMPETLEEGLEHREDTTTPSTTKQPSSSAGALSITSSTLSLVPQQGTAKPSFCPETERRGLKWPATRLNNPARMTCPNNADAYAEWWCSDNGEWTLENPDLSRCVSSWARQLDSQSRSIDNDEMAKSLARNLQADTRANRLYGGDTSTAVNVMQRLADTVDSLPQTGETGSHRMDFLIELHKYLVETGSNLLQEERRAAWLDLPPSNQTGTADGLIDAVEQMAVITAKQLNGPASSVPLVSPKITVEVSGVQIQDYVQFPARSLYDTRLDNIQLPRAALERSGHSTLDWAKVVFALYDVVLGEYMKPESAVVKDENGEDVMVERKIASRLMSASIVKIGHNGGSTPLLDDGTTPVALVGHLKQPVYMNFALKKVEENMSNPTCVYWRRSDKKWASNGCTIRKRNETHVSCSCNHLTTFAVLMDVRGLPLDPLHRLALSFITCVGCIVSICCCAMAILAFCCFSGPQYSDRITIHKNLCFCLLVAESVFLFGIAQTQHRLACSVVAGVLHYFFLAAFAWMLLEGFQLYSLLIEVFESERSRKPFFYLFGYGMPAIIVGISVLVDYNSYGTRRHCWLNTENYFVLSFVGPVAAVLLANLIFLTMALVVMCRHATFSAGHRHDSNKSAVENVGRWLKGATVLVILLGLTWTLGLLYINDSTLIMAYLFTALNSLQGCFIFVFHVLLNEKTRKEWNRWLLRHRGRTTSSWLRSPAAAADYKPAKVHLEEPMPMLIGVVRTTESEQLPTNTTNSSGPESTSILSKLFGTGQRKRNSGRGSVGQLLLVRSGSPNSTKACKYEYPYASHCCSSDEAATNSDLTVESPCPRYYVSARPPPSFPPPSPPQYSPRYYARRTAPTGGVAVFPGVDYGRQRGAGPGAFGSLGRPEHRVPVDEDGNVYASTEGYFSTDLDRPDSGYSGSGHQPTPPPPVTCDAAPGSAAPCVGGVSPAPRKLDRLQKKARLDDGCQDRRPNVDLSYEVPLHASTANPASTSLYGDRA